MFNICSTIASAIVAHSCTSASKMKLKPTCIQGYMLKVTNPHMHNSDILLCLNIHTTWSLKSRYCAGADPGPH